jgi:hypothetical protein
MATRMQQRRGTASQWTAGNPVLAAGEIGYETDTNKFKIGNGSDNWLTLDYFVDSNSLVNPSFGTSVTFEGATDNAYETTLIVTDPTADRTVTIPNVNGTIITTGNMSDLTNVTDLTVSGNLTVNGTVTALNSTEIDVATSFVFEGSTADAYETTLRVTDPTADRTITLPDASGIVQLQVANVTNTEIGFLDGVTLPIQEQLDDKQAKVTGVTDTEIGYLNGVTSSIQDQLESKQNSIGGVTDTEIGYLDGVTSGIQSQLDSKLSTSTASSTYAPINNPTFTGTVTLPTGAVTSAMILDGTIVSGDLATNAVAATNIASNAVTTAKILDENVTTAKIADSAVTTAKIANANVTNVKIADGSVDSGKLGDSAVSAIKIAPDAVTTIKILNANVTDAKLASSAVTTAKIADAAVTLAKIADGAVESSKIADLTIVNGDISATAAIALSKLATDPLARANHTGTQLSSTISDFTEAAQDAVGTILGTGLTYSDASNTITVDSTNVQLRVANVSDTEIGYLDGVTSAIQTQLDAKLASSTAASTYATIANDNLKATLASPALTGVPTAPTAAAATNTTQIATTAFVRAEVSALVGSAGSTLDTLGEIATALGNDANLSTTLTTSIGLKAPLASPTFTGTVTLPAAGIVFTDGTQSKEGVPSRTVIYGATNSNALTASATLSTLAYRDSLLEVNSASAVTLSIPTNTTAAFPIGTTIDILQTGAGQVTIAPVDGTVTVNATPGLKLRATWSSCTLLKRGTNTWVVYGDLSA